MKQNRVFGWIALCSLCIACSGALVGEVEPPPRIEDISGHWCGYLLRTDEHRKLPLVNFSVDLKFDDTGWTGTARSDSWGNRDWALSHVSVAGWEVSFALPPSSGGQGVFVGAVNRGVLSGDYSWGGEQHSVSLLRKVGPPATRPTRREVPIPPFPYQTRDVGFRSNGVCLTATLYIPKQSTPRPAVLLLTGSGADMRDAGIPGAPIPGATEYMLIADALSRRGFVVMLVDDRGIGESGGDLAHSSIQDQADDAIAAVRVLHSHPATDPTKISAVGISEGGIIALAAAAQCPLVNHVVTVVSPITPGDETVLEASIGLTRRCSIAIDRDSSLWVKDPERARREYFESDSYRYTTGLIKLGKTNISSSEMRTNLGDWVREMHNGLGDSPNRVDQLVEAQMAILTPHFRSLLLHDPSKDAARIKVPITAILGGADFKVDSKKTADLWRKLRQDEGVSVIVISNMEHGLSVEGVEDGDSMHPEFMKQLLSSLGTR